MFLFADNYFYDSEQEVDANRNNLGHSETIKKMQKEIKCLQKNSFW